ncbi:MAG: hypothetical protein ACRCYY_02175 [Trueperaceae bacterium]
MPLRALAGDGSGSVEDVAASINWAVERGSKVIQLSLGTERRACRSARGSCRTSN